MNLLAAIKESIETASLHSKASQNAPTVVLWTDPDGQWEAAVRQLREVWHHLLTLGEHQPDRRTGPAIWIKCMLARTLPEADWAAEEIPVIYLPGVSRLDLRAVENLPDDGSLSPHDGVSG